MQQVSQKDPEQDHHAPFVGALGPVPEGSEAESQLQQSQGELERRAGLQVDSPQKGPQGAEGDPEQENVDRVDSLEDGGRTLGPADGHAQVARSHHPFKSLASPRSARGGPQPGEAAHGQAVIPGGGFDQPVHLFPGELSLALLLDADGLSDSLFHQGAGVPVAELLLGKQRQPHQLGVPGLNRDAEGEGAAQVASGQPPLFGHPVDVAVGKVVHRAAGLFEEGPEEHGEEGEDQHHVHPLPGHLVQPEGLHAQVDQGHHPCQHQDEAGRRAHLGQDIGGNLQDGVAAGLEAVHHRRGDDGDVAVGRNQQRQQGNRQHREKVDRPLGGDWTGQGLAQALRIRGSAHLSRQPSPAQRNPGDTARDQERDTHKDIDAGGEGIVGAEVKEPEGCRQRARHDQNLGEADRGHEDRQTGEHSQGGQPEAVVPAIGLADVAAQQGRHGRPQVDPHVEDGEARVPLGAALRIERTHHGRDVGLEKSIAHDQQGQGQEEGQVAFRRHHQVAGSHQQATQNDGPPGAQQPVGQHAAKERGHVDQRRVGAIDGIGIPVAVSQEALEHVEQQQGAHPVEGKALPHLGKEQGEQARRMSKQGSRLLRIHRLCSLMIGIRLRRSPVRGWDGGFRRGRTHPAHGKHRKIARGLQWRPEARLPWENMLLPLPG